MSRSGSLFVKLFLALILISSTILTACGGGSSSNAPYKIGALFAVTGFNAPLGTPERDTAQMVVDELNKNGGINGHQIQLIVYDTESDNTKATTAAKKLIEQDKVLAIIGPSSTGESMAIIDTVQKAQIPLISCAASAQIVTPADQKKWVFKSPQSDSLAVSELFDYFKAHSISKIAIMTSTGGFGTTGKGAIDAALPQSGLTVSAAETFGDTDTDMTVQLTKIKATDAQALLVWGTNPAPALIAKGAKQLGMTIPVFMSHGIANQKFIELAGDAANGVIFPAGKLLVANDLPATDPQKAVLQKYAADFQAKYNKTADTFGGHAFDALTMISNALKTVGGDSAKIRDEIEKTQGLVGIGGVFNMSAQDHNGLTKGAFVMVKIVDGKWTWEKN